jgi:hypothetical protein
LRGTPRSPAASSGVSKSPRVSPRGRDLAADLSAEACDVYGAMPILDPGRDRVAIELDSTAFRADAARIVLTTPIIVVATRVVSTITLLLSR